jgi:hypothetical protein
MRGQMALPTMRWSHHDAVFFQHHYHECVLAMYRLLPRMSESDRHLSHPSPRFELTGA